MLVWVKDIPNIQLSKIFGCKKQDNTRMIKKVAYNDFTTSALHILSPLRLLN